MVAFHRPGPSHHPCHTVHLYSLFKQNTTFCKYLVSVVWEPLSIVPFLCSYCKKFVMVISIKNVILVYIALALLLNYSLLDFTLPRGSSAIIVLAITPSLSTITAHVRFRPIALHKWCLDITVVLSSLKTVTYTDIGRHAIAVQSPHTEISLLLMQSLSFAFEIWGSIMIGNSYNSVNK